MRKLTLILSFILLLSGCSTEEEVCYSCNSEIDSWVKTNKTELINMSRKELSKFDMPHQQAALRMFSSKRKKELWTEKYNEVLQKHNFTKEEVQHLSYVEGLIKNKDFSITNTEKEDEITFDWLNEGMVKFGWSKEFLYNSFFTYGTIDSPYGRIEYFSGSEASKNACNCRYWCWAWWQECYKGGCDETSGGCGVIGSSNCDSICY